MPGAYDGLKRPVLDHDPTKTIQWQVGMPARGLGQTLNEAIDYWVGLAVDAINESIQEIIEAIIGFPTTVETWLDDIADWAANVPKLIEGFLPKWLIPDLDASIITSGFLSTDRIKDFWSEVVDILQGEPLDAQHLFGLIAPQNLGQVSASIIGDFFANLLDNPLFEGLEAIASSVWSWDETQYHSLPGGSAKVILNGTNKELLSNLIPVTKDQVLDLSAWVKYASVSGSGAPLQLGLTNYFNGAAVGQPIIATQGLTPSTSDWRRLAGTYTVPANVDSVRLRLSVASSAVSGTVWWDDTKLSKTQPLLQWLVGGQDGGTLTNDIENLFTGIVSNTTQILDRALKGDLTALQEALDPSGTLAAIEARINNFLHPGSTLNADRIGLGAIGNEFIPGLCNEIDNAVRGLFNIGGSGYSQDDSASAYAHVADTIAGMQSRLSQLYGERTAGGRNFYDDFERTGSNPGANWGVIYPEGGGSGGPAVDGHNLYYAKSGTAKRVWVARWLPAVTYTNAQLVIVTLNSKAERPLILGGSENPGYNSVLGRVSDDGRSYMEFRMGCGEAWLFRVINLVYSIVDYKKYSGADPGPGSALTMQATVDGDDLFFSCRHNANGVINVRDTAALVGPGFRGVGLGGVAGHATFYQLSPGEVRAWMGADQ
jgi:hypothetical protein